MTVSLYPWSYSYSRAVFAAMCDETIMVEYTTEGEHVAVLDPVHGSLSQPVLNTIYIGPARVFRQVEQQPAESGGVERAHLEWTIMYPWDGPDIPIGSRVTIQNSTDPLLIGRVLTTNAVMDRSTLLITRRISSASHCA